MPPISGVDTPSSSLAQTEPTGLFTGEETYAEANLNKTSPQAPVVPQAPQGEQSAEASPQPPVQPQTPATAPAQPQSTFLGTDLEKANFLFADVDTAVNTNFVVKPNNVKFEGKNQTALNVIDELSSKRKKAGLPPLDFASVFKVTTGAIVQGRAAGRKGTNIITQSKELSGLSDIEKASMIVLSQQLNPAAFDTTVEHEEKKELLLWAEGTLRGNGIFPGHNRKTSLPLTKQLEFIHPSQLGDYETSNNFGSIVTGINGNDITQPGKMPAVSLALSSEDVPTLLDFVSVDVRKVPILGPRLTELDKQATRVAQLQEKEVNGTLETPEREELNKLLFFRGMQMVSFGGLTVVNSIKNSVSPALFGRLKSLITPRARQPEEYISLNMERMGSIRADNLLAKKEIKPLRSAAMADKELITQALTNPAAVKMVAKTGTPEEIRKFNEIVAKTKPVREHIDALSTAIAREFQLINKVNGNKHEDLIISILDNRGEYVRRTYLRDILGKDYVPPPDKLEAAKNYLKKNLVIREPRISPEKKITRVTEKHFKPSKPLNELMQEQFFTEQGKQFVTRAANDVEVDNAIEGILKGHQTEFFFGKGGGKRVDLSSVKHRGEIPFEIRQLMGEIDDGAYTAARTVADQTALLNNLKFFRNISFNPEWASDTAQAGFSAQKLEGAKYGLLHGKYVRQDIYDDIVELSDVKKQNGFWTDSYFTWLNGWRAAKTVGDPTVHARNLLTNFGPFMDFAGMDLVRDAKHYAVAMDGIRKMDDEFMTAVKSGLGGEFAQAELSYMSQKLRPLAEEFLEKHGGSTLAQWTRFIATKAGQKYENLKDLYALEDVWPKYATYRKYLADGMSPREAVAEVNRWYPNYDLVPKVISKARQSVAGSIIMNPFVSFTSESMRITANAFREKPIKLYKWSLGYPAAIGTFTMYYNGMTLNDVANIYAGMPTKEKYRAQIPLWYRDNEGSLKMLDMAQVLPLGNALQTQGVLGTVFNANPAVGIPSLFVGNNPFLTTAVETIANKDLFTDSPLSRPSDTNEIISKFATTATKNLTPLPNIVMEGIRMASEGPQTKLQKQLGKEVGPTDIAVKMFSPIKPQALDIKLKAREIELMKRKTSILDDARRISISVGVGTMTREEGTKREQELRREVEKLGKEFIELERAKASAK